MATGIFSTTRVAGEGVALAIASAVLSALTQHALPSGSAAQTAVAAQRLVTGDMAGAAHAMPLLPPATIVQHYSEAFTMLLLILGVVTLVTATVVMLFLRSETIGGTSDAVVDCESAARL
jgi:CHASE1-domain containing sensor protein